MLVGRGLRRVRSKLISWLERVRGHTDRMRERESRLLEQTAFAGIIQVSCIWKWSMHILSDDIELSFYYL